MTTRHQIIRITAGLALSAFVLSTAVASAQVTQRTGVPPQAASKQPPAPPPAPEPNYIIGPDDVLVVNVWNEKTASGEVVVRPDGKITLPMGSDIVASGLTTEELRKKVVEELKRGFFDDPTVSIQVKTINSRNVYITGSVNKPGRYALSGPMTVLMLITSAGGLQEFADKKHITIISATLKAKDGGPLSFEINYEDLLKRKNLAKNNVELRPGDQVIVK